jgi:hypothetical protein
LAAQQEKTRRKPYPTPTGFAQFFHNEFCVRYSLTCAKKFAEKS